MTADRAARAEETAPVLVTGAAGFLGRAVVAHLCSSRRVCALVKQLPDRPLPSGAVPVVRDLAQSPRYRDFPEGALDVFEVNVGSTQRLLDWAYRNQVKRFIYASSGGIYGHGDTAFDEDAAVEATGILQHYLASKRCGELLAGSYRAHMTVIVVRLFFLYGPGQRRSMLIPRLVDNVLQGRPIVLQGQDGIRLNPVYVEDAAAAIGAAALLGASDWINVAGPEVLTLREIGGLIGRATGREPVFEVHPNVQPKHVFGDTGKMARLLGAPRVDVAEGLRRTVTADQAERRDSRTG